MGEDWLSILKAATLCKMLKPNLLSDISSSFYSLFIVQSLNRGIFKIIPQDMTHILIFQTRPEEFFSREQCYSLQQHYTYFDYNVGSC
jgi:hypothetical protein